MPWLNEDDRIFGVITICTEEELQCCEAKGNLDLFSFRLIIIYIPEGKGPP